MAGAQLNSVFPFSPSQAVSESRIFEQEYHFLQYLFYENAGTKILFLLHDSGIDDPHKIAFKSRISPNQQKSSETKKVVKANLL